MSMDAIAAISQPVVSRRIPASWLTRQPQVAAERLPIQLDLSPSPLGALVICAAGLLLLSSTWGLLETIAQAADPVAFVSASVFPLIGAGLIAAGLVQLYRRQTVTFGESGVEVAERNVTGSRRWSVAYRDYAGVLQREHTVHRKNSSTTYQIVQLLHADPAYDLPLHVVPGDRPVRERWESLAERLRLPAMQLDDDRIVSRPAGALDAPLAEHMRSGRLPGGDVPAAPPPPSIKVLDDTMTGTVRIELQHGRIPMAGYALLAMFSLPFMATGFLNRDGWPLAAAGVAVLAGVGLARWKDVTSPRAIAITPERIEINDTWRWNPADPLALDISQIEGVRIYRSSKAGSLVLVIESDRGSMHVGQGLSRSDLAWLRVFVTARIVAAQAQGSRSAGFAQRSRQHLI